MKSFGAYISKYLASFAAFILLLLFINVIIFVVAFHKTVTEDYGATSPRTMLERTAASVTHDALSEEAAQRLREQNIWALYLTPDGNCFWAFRKAIRFRMLHYFLRGIWLIILFLSGIQPMVFWY